MSVFISWAGQESLSHKGALLLKNWIPGVLFALEDKCFVSSKDIGAGSLWLPELLDELKKSDYGIICVTRESVERSWMVFEAGALAMRVEGEISRVCPLLLDLSDSEFKGPLTAFQYKKLDLADEPKSKEDVLSIIKVLNSGQEEKFQLNDAQLAKQFERCWPELWQPYLELRRSSPIARSMPAISRDEVIVEVRGALRQIAGTLLEMRKGMATTVAQESAESLQRFDVECPFCGAPAAALMPARAGQTKPLICEKCEGRFNVHTTDARTAFVRAISTPPPMSDTGPTFVAEVNCPKCAEGLSVEMRDRSGETRTVLCPKCKSAVGIHKSGSGGVFARINDYIAPEGDPTTIAWRRWVKQTGMFVQPDVLQMLLPKTMEALASRGADRQLTPYELCSEIQSKATGESGSYIARHLVSDFLKAVLAGGGFTFAERPGIGVLGWPITNTPDTDAILLAYTRGVLGRLRVKYNLSEADYPRLFGLLFNERIPSGQAALHQALSELSGPAKEQDLTNP